MARAARPALLAAVAIMVAAGITGPAQARKGKPHATAAERDARSAGKKRQTHRARALRVRKRARRRGSWGHVPAWLRVAYPFNPAAASLPAPAAGVPAPAPDAPGAPPLGAPAPAPALPPPPAPPPSGCGTAVGAREGEWYVTLTRATACAGQVTIEAQNYGEDPHDLRIQRENGPELASWPVLGPGGPGGVLAKKVTLTTGRYTLYCTLLGGTPPGTPGESHAAAGMTATLTIVAR